MDQMKTMIQQDKKRFQSRREGHSNLNRTKIFSRPLTRIKNSFDQRFSFNERRTYRKQKING